jgi:hypothetical protein
MAKPKRHPLTARELIAKLRPYGVFPFVKRGKGSERILVKPDDPPSDPSKPLKGPQYPIKYHGPATEINVPVINALLRRFGIDEDEFWE